MTVEGTLSPPSTRIPFARPDISEEARRAAAEALGSGWITTGPQVAAFEQEFASWVGAAEAVAVSSCTAAIELGLRALRLPPGAKVLTSTMTFCGAVHAILHAGLDPVLCDVHPDTLMPDPATTAAAVRRAGGVDAMVVLHFAGQPAPVHDLAAAAGVPLARVVEDAAHALGTWVGDRRVGTISAATCFSFYATKNLPIGEGGMLTSQDPGIADFARQARLHGMSRDAWKRYLPGQSWRYAVAVAGLKANMTDVQAAVGRAQLAHVPGWQDRRAALAKRYDNGLSDTVGIDTPSWPTTGQHAWHLYVVRVRSGYGWHRDELIEELAAGGIDCSVHFIPVHHQPYFQGAVSSARSAFPNADAAFEEIVSLPLYPSLTFDDVDRVCAAVRLMAARSSKGRTRSA